MNNYYTMNNKRKVLIIGEHPIKDCIRQQFAAQEYDVTMRDAESVMQEEVWDEIVVAIGDDNEALRLIEQFKESFDPETRVRPMVHLLLQSQETLWLLNTRDYKDDWHKTFELNAFTIEDVWAKNVVLGKGLDYMPISLESDRTVHLVVFGTSQLTTALVEHAALVAHYPNYTRDHSLRTRITVIDDDVMVWGKRFISMHKSLMDNSHYRIIDTTAKTYELYKPMYDGKREDFVDVEWEFVNASVHDQVVQDKLQGWAADERKVLSIAVCGKHDSENLSQAMLIADILGAYEVPIYMKQKNSVAAKLMEGSPRLRNIVPIGMVDSGYNINLPLLKMAKRVKFVYDYCYDNNIIQNALTEGIADITAPSYIDDDEAAAHWLQEGTALKRYSNICNAMTLQTKMRSLGHVMGAKDSKDSKVSKVPTVSEVDTFYAITKEETEIIAMVEHNRWSVEELLLGFRSCTDEEQAEIEADISKKGEYKKRLAHYDLRAYNDLRADDTGMNVNTYDICLSASIPLIVYKGE